MELDFEVLQLNGENYFTHQGEVKKIVVTYQCYLGGNVSACTLGFSSS